MRGRKLSGIPLMVVSLVLCLLSSSLIAGEHPWGRDNNGPGSSNGTLPVDSTIMLGTSGGSCGVGSNGSGPITETSRESWQWRLVMRISYWFMGHTFETPIQRDQKRVQSTVERN